MFLLNLDQLRLRVFIVTAKSMKENDNMVSKVNRWQQYFNNFNNFLLTRFMTMAAFYTP